MHIIVFSLSSFLFQLFLCIFWHHLHIKTYNVGVLLSIVLWWFCEAPPRLSPSHSGKKTLATFRQSVFATMNISQSIAYGSRCHWEKTHRNWIPIIWVQFCLGGGCCGARFLFVVMEQNLKVECTVFATDHSWWTCSMLDEKDCSHSYKHIAQCDIYTTYIVLLKWSFPSGCRFHIFSDVSYSPYNVTTTAQFNVCFAIINGFRSTVYKSTILGKPSQVHSTCT